MKVSTLKEYLPLLSICIILSGLIKQMVYYNHFGIEIQYYLTASELLLVLCNDLPLMLYIPLLGYLILSSKIDISFKEAIYTLAIGIIFILLMVFVLPSDPLAIGGMGLLTIALIYPRIISFIDKNFLNSGIEIKLLHRYIYNLSIIIYFVIIVILQGNRDIYKANNGFYVGTEITTKDSSYISDKDHYFIGRTNNYYFIFNHHCQESSSILVLPEHDVSKFILKTRYLKYFN